MDLLEGTAALNALNQVCSYDELKRWDTQADRMKERKMLKRLIRVNLDFSENEMQKMKELLQSAQALHIRGYTAASTKEALPSLPPPKAFPPPGAISAPEAPSPAATFASEVPHRTCSYHFVSISGLSRNLNSQWAE